MEGWFTVNDPELLLTNAMTDGKAFTVSARVYVPASVMSTGTGSWDGTDKHNMIASLGDSSFGLRLTTGSGGGTTAVHAFVGDGGNWYQINTAQLGSEFTDQWHDIAVTYQGTNLILYVDGEAVAHREDAGNVYNSGVAFGVGWDPTKSLRTSELTMEHIAVYSEALSAEELAAEHSASDENVLLWMDFEKEEIHEHSFGEWTVTTEPTCTDKGEETRSCECGETEKREVEALGHDYEAVVTAPTCTDKGYTTYTCSRCGDSYVADETPALGHTEEVIPGKEPTCTETGLTEGKKCTVCGVTTVEQEIIPALGHDYINGECSRCDAVLTSKFEDVEAGDFFFDPVEWAVEKGITTGKTETLFDPEGECQRATVVTFLWRAAGEPEPTITENPFTDVKESHFFYKAVLWAVEEGITNGLTTTTFGPYENCNRAQVVTFLHRAMKTPAPTTAENPFSDVEAKDFFYNAVLWAVENNITNGLTATTFAPDTVCNRAQVVTFLYRTYNK